MSIREATNFAIERGLRTLHNSQGQTIVEQKIPESYQTLGYALRNLIDEKKASVLKDAAVVEEALKKEGVSSLLIAQFRLVLEQSDIGFYCSQTDFSITNTDVNNMAQSMVFKTGLTPITVRNLITALLIGLRITVAEGRIGPYYHDGYLTNGCSDTLPPQDYLSTLDKIDKAFASEDKEKINEVLPDLHILARAGIPRALYYQGLSLLHDYEETIHAKAYELFRAAAEEGCMEANQYLGDAWFYNRPFNYTNAYHYYTNIASIALDKTRRENIRVILKSREENRQTLCINGIMTILMILFHILAIWNPFSIGMSVTVVWSVLCIAFLGLIFLCAVWYFFGRPFNRYKWVGVSLWLIFSICTFFAFL